jgi:hypothetical protein
MPHLHRTLFASACIVALVVACGNDFDDTITPKTCTTLVDRATLSSPEGGVVTAQGEFPPDESILMRFVTNGATRTATGEISGDRKTATFRGLPTGALEVTFIASCDEVGQDVLGSAQITVQ